MPRVCWLLPHSTFTRRDARVCAFVDLPFAAPYGAASLWPGLVLFWLQCPSYCLAIITSPTGSGPFGTHSDTALRARSGVIGLRSFCHLVFDCRRSTNPLRSYALSSLLYFPAKAKRAARHGGSGDPESTMDVNMSSMGAGESFDTQTNLAHDTSSSISLAQLREKPSQA